MANRDLEARTKARKLRLAELDNELRILSRNYARIQSRNMRNMWEERRRKLWDEERKIRVEQIDDVNYLTPFWHHAKITDSNRNTLRAHYTPSAFGHTTDRFARETNELRHIPHRALQEGYSHNSLPGTSGIIYSSNPPSKPVNSIYKHQTKPVNRTSTVKNTLPTRKGGSRKSRATRRRRY